VRCHAGRPKAPIEPCDTKSTTPHGKQDYGLTLDCQYSTGRHGFWENWRSLEWETLTT
jgi:hypothetical protein